MSTSPMRQLALQHYQGQLGRAEFRRRRRELIADIVSAAQGESGAQSSPPAPAGAPSPVRRWVPVVAGALLVLAGLGIAIWLADVPPSVPVPAPAPLADQREPVPGVPPPVPDLPRPAPVVSGDVAVDRLVRALLDAESGPESWSAGRLTDFLAQYRAAAPPGYSAAGQTWYPALEGRIEREREIDRQLGESAEDVAARAPLLEDLEALLAGPVPAPAPQADRSPSPAVTAAGTQPPDPEQPADAPEVPTLPSIPELPGEQVAHASGASAEPGAANPIESGVGLPAGGGRAPAASGPPERAAGPVDPETYDGTAATASPTSTVVVAGPVIASGPPQPGAGNNSTPVAAGASPPPTSGATPAAASTAGDDAGAGAPARSAARASAPSDSGAVAARAAGVQPGAPGETPLSARTDGGNELSARSVPATAGQAGNANGEAVAASGSETPEARSPADPAGASSGAPSGAAQAPDSDGQAVEQPSPASPQPGAGEDASPQAPGLVATPTATGGALSPAADVRADRTEQEPAALRAASDGSGCTAARVGSSKRGRKCSDRLAVGGDGPAMVVLSPGSYQRGSDRDASEQPRAQVSIGYPFAIAERETSVAEYRRFCESIGRPCPADPYGDDHVPVVNVSYEDAFAYAHWLAAQTGKRYRLPTEDEWEFVARDGADTLYPHGDGVHVTSGPASINHADTHPSLISNRPADPRQGFSAGKNTGVYHMSGNVREWTFDGWTADHRGAPTDGRRRASASDLGVVRGGSFADPPARTRPAARESLPRGHRDARTGFRVLLDLREP